MKIISQRLREARVASGLSQQDMADRLGLTSVGYGSFERGRTLPSIDYLMEMARILQKPVTYFLGLDGELPEEESNALELFRSLPNTEAKRMALVFLRSWVEQLGK